MIEKHSRKLIVVSAINIFKGGSLTIAREFIRELDRSWTKSGDQWAIIVFCHLTEQYRDLDLRNVELIEKPNSRRCWLIRLWYEYFWFWFWSRSRDVDTWVSLHDITPNVKAKHRYVYCHNPAPFYKGNSVWRYEPSFELFRRFYSSLYRINILKNEKVIVQQQWLREEFVTRYKIDPTKVVVALPAQSLSEACNRTKQRELGSEIIIIYPAIPRPFKNFEVLLNAMALLRRCAVKLILTIDGNENRYARELRARYHSLDNVEFAGYMNHIEMKELYSRADAMVFPSKLETWGLPISEFKSSLKPIFAADLPYAHETLSDYGMGYYFPSDDHGRLAEAIKQLIGGTLPPQSVVHALDYASPIARNWSELLSIMELKERVYDLH